MAIAQVAAQRSKDPSTQVGACLVNKDGNVIGIGYNSMPKMSNAQNDDSFPWKRPTRKGIPNSKYKYLYG